MQAALQLVAAAEAAATRAGCKDPFVWRQNMMRLVANPKQVILSLLMEHVFEALPQHSMSKLARGAYQSLCLY